MPFLPSGQTYTAVAAGRNHSLALTSAGQVVTWGNRAYDVSVVPAPPIGKAYTAVAAGGWHSLALASGTSESSPSGPSGSLGFGS
ncbi:hypothetical protein GS528_28115 [Rhodococcus hoagii]|nr:hypothetical protein [Prescottella equi]NKT41244.1 hypothetical protein [Prescottella equi]